MSVPEDVGDWVNRRRLGVLVLVLVALLGVGLGTLTDGPDGPQPPVVDVTPTTPTPAPPGTPDGSTPTPPDGGTPTPTPPPATPQPTPTPTPGDGGGGGGAGAGSSSPVILEAVGSSTILQYSGLKPGDAGSNSVVLRNSGTLTARLDISDISVSDDENGIVAAEASVDSPGDGGELSQHVMMEITVTYPNGTTQHLYNTDAGARSLADLASVSSPAVGGELDPGQEATVTFDWHVPSSTGNEIQSDESSFEVDFRLRST